METKSKAEREFLRRVKEPPNKEVLQEDLNNPRRVGGVVTYYAVQPHNYRRYFNFTREEYYPTKPYLLLNHGSEYHFMRFGCKLIIRKKSAEVINLWHKKQWRVIGARSRAELQAAIDDIDEGMRAQCVAALKQFIEENGGSSDFGEYRAGRAEWGIKGDSFIDSIPRDLIIHDDRFKKVYDNKLEIYSAEHVRTYLTNRMVEDVAPEMARALWLTQPMRLIKKRCKCVDDLLRMCDVIRLLGPAELRELEDWAIESLGVHA